MAACSRGRIACCWRTPKAMTCWACWLPPNHLRRELSGNLVTYVVNRNINFTNVCFVGCKFCAFSRGPRESDTYFLTPEQVAQKGASKRGKSALPKSAFKAACRTVFLLSTIATFCAR